jgi:hypothetical protein
MWERRYKLEDGGAWGLIKATLSDQLDDVDISYKSLIEHGLC